MPTTGPETVQTSEGLMHRMRLLAVVACALALGLTGWRAMETFTLPAAQAGTGSAHEQDLVAVVETVAGRNNVHLTLRRDAAGKRHVLVLVDGAEMAASPDAAQIETLLASAAGLDTAAGDTLDIQQFPFARSASARPDQAELAELAGLGPLTLLLGFIAFMPERPGVQTRARVMPGRETDIAAAHLPRLVAEPAETAISDDTRLASHEAARDPAGAANVLRQWMLGKETTA